MIIADFIIASNPFFEAYWQSDLVGKSIYIALLALSICTWTLLIQKFLLTKRSRQESLHFQQLFQRYRQTPLTLELPLTHTTINPFRDIYLVIKKYTLDILNKNRRFGKKGADGACLSHTDIDFVLSHIATTISDQTKNLEKNLYILSTIVTLAPFLGLLGTVWGILTAFSEMQVHSSGNTNQMVLGGLSLALTTTVLGLIDAIPALIGYNYLKHKIRDFQTEMEGFSNDMLASVEIQYREVDLK